MMVPRSYGHTSILNAKRPSLDEKDGGRSRTRAHDQAATYQMGASPPRSVPRSISDPPGTIRSDPVKIPTQRNRRSTPTTARPSPASSQTSRPAIKITVEPRIRESPQHILTATSIPLRKRPKGRSVQRLPDCDHVADFSKLLLDDVQPGSDGSLAGSLGNPHFDGLFGNIDELVEGQMIVGSEGVDASILSTRSVSSESMPSLGSSDDFTSNDLTSLSPCARRSIDRKLRQLASSEGADGDHPLMQHDVFELSPPSSSSQPSTPRALSPSRRPLPRKDKTSTFKSSLSASLRALRSAAQSVSNIATTPPIIQPDDFLTRSFFNIQPSLTDDKRPPPSETIPSPELRRYLNPNILTAPADSPAQLHFWHDDRSTLSPSPTKTKKKKKRDLSKSSNPKSRSPSPPPTIQLQSCIPPSIRTANASAPPIWLSPDGTPSNKNTVDHTPTFTGAGAARQREPRENRDFLRVLVAEMNMRRAGKFEESMAGRAKMWIEARGGSGGDDSAADKKIGKERWAEWNADDL